MDALAVTAVKGEHSNHPLQVLRLQDCDLRPYPDGCDNVPYYLRYPSPDVADEERVKGDGMEVYADSDGDGGGNSMDIPNSMESSNPNTNSYSSYSYMDNPNNMASSSHSTNRM